MSPALGLSVLQRDPLDIYPLATQAAYWHMVQRALGGTSYRCQMRLYVPLPRC